MKISIKCTPENVGEGLNLGKKFSNLSVLWKFCNYSSQFRLLEISRFFAANFVFRENTRNLWQIPLLRMVGGGVDLGKKVFKFLDFCEISIFQYFTRSFHLFRFEFWSYLFLYEKLEMNSDMSNMVG